MNQEKLGIAGMLKNYITLVGHAGQSSHPSTILKNMPISSMAG